jgi:hypothetical protein
MWAIVLLILPTTDTKAQRLQDHPKAARLHFQSVSIATSMLQSHRHPYSNSSVQVYTNANLHRQRRGNLRKHHHETSLPIYILISMIGGKRTGPRKKNLPCTVSGRGSYLGDQMCVSRHAASDSCRRNGDV